MRRANVEEIPAAAVEVAAAATGPPAWDTDREDEAVVVVVPTLLLGCHWLLQPPRLDRVVRTLGSAQVLQQREEAKGAVETLGSEVDLLPLLKDAAAAAVAAVETTTMTTTLLLPAPGLLWRVAPPWDWVAPAACVGDECCDCGRFAWCRYDRRGIRELK